MNTEPRIASYIGIAWGQLPPEHYYRMYRTLPRTVTQTQVPEGLVRTYRGVEVFEGHYTYRDMRIVPSWGGSMFEALMVPLFVPEDRWAPRELGRKSSALCPGPDRARSDRGPLRLLGLLSGVQAQRRLQDIRRGCPWH